MLFTDPGAVMLAALAVLVAAICLCSAVALVAATVDYIRKMRG